MRSFKLIFFFFINFFDFKLDFPFPPKHIFRVFDYTYWATFFIHYYQRKNESRKITRKIKENYNDWLYKTYNVQYNTIVNEEFFEKISYKSKRIFEGGIGSGSACACYLSFLREKKIKNKLEYFGIDINKKRLLTANKFLKRFLQNEKNIKLSLKYGNLNKIPFKENFFDFSFLPSVLERIDNKNITKVIDEICRVSKRGIYVSDLYDRLPNGTPRSHKIYEKMFLKNGFIMSKFTYEIKKPKRKKYIGNHCILQILFLKKD